MCCDPSVGESDRWIPSQHSLLREVPAQANERF
ncbi:hypothetical protein LEMLEM_LOCUS22901, partial [Lemmus lemmus]